MRLVLAAASLMAIMPAAAQQTSVPSVAERPALTQFPGSGWWLAPPPGFTPSSTPVAAFRHPSGAQIVLVEFPRQSLTRASFGQIGDVSAPGTPEEGRLLSVEAVTAGGRPAFLATARLTQRGAAAYNLVMEGSRGNVAATLTAPDAATGIDPAAIRASLLSLTDRPPAPAQPASPSRVPFPGTNWSIAPPAGFALDGTSPAMFRHANGSVIMLIEQPKMRIVAEDFSIGAVLNQGTANESRVEHVEGLTLAGRPALLVRMRMTRLALLAHVMVVEGEGGNVTAHMQVPASAAHPDPAAVRATLLSVTETRRSPEQRLGDLPFRLNELAGMRIVSVAANSVVILTDGPGDLMDEATDQPFVMVSRFPTGPRDRFDAARDLPAMAALIRERYAGATILSQKVEPSPQGPVATVVFLRTPPGKAAAVAGVAWALAQESAGLFFIGQFPPERSDLPARFIRIRNGVRPR